MGFKMKGYRGFHGNKKSALKQDNDKVHTDQPNIETDWASEREDFYNPETGLYDNPGTGHQTEFSDRYNYYISGGRAKHKDPDTGEWVGYDKIPEPSITTNEDTGELEYSHPTSRDWDRLGYKDSINPGAVSIDYQEDTPSSRGGSSVTIDSQMLEDMNFRNREIERPENWDDLPDSSKEWHIFNEALNTHARGIKKGQDMELNFSGMDYLGPTWSEKKGKYAQQWKGGNVNFTYQGPGGEHNLNLYEKLRKEGLDTTHYDRRFLEFLDKKGKFYQENYLDKDDESGDGIHTDVPPGDGEGTGGGSGGGSGGGTGGGGGIVLPTKHIEFEPINGDPPGPVETPPGPGRINDPNKRQDVINNLAKLGSDKRKLQYDQLNWKYDDTIPGYNRDGSKIEETIQIPKAKDALGNLNQPKQKKTPEKPKTTPVDIAKTFVKAAKTKKTTTKKDTTKKDKKKWRDTKLGDKLSGVDLSQLGAQTKDTLDSIFGGV